MLRKKIVIAGGTGFIGSGLTEWFGQENEIFILTRNAGETNNTFGSGRAGRKAASLRYVAWDGRTQGPWTTILEGADLLINLSGKSVNCRYTEANKAAIFSSRLEPTRALGEAVRSLQHPPALWVNLASATIYRHAEDRPMDEYTGEIENDFSVQVCKQWEQTFFAEDTPATRKVALRTAVTLGNGGVMIPYCNLVKFGLGGCQGNGRQMYSWVHLHDVARMIDWLFDHPECSGVYNCAAPFPVANRVFMQTLRQVAGHAIGLPAPAWMLQIGARMIGTEPELLLKSRWVLPTRITEAGFVFQYPELKGAMEQVIGELPRKRYHLF
ncbi:TIGR01777 family oxidoreductase [Chitinophaga lutea]